MTKLKLGVVTHGEGLVFRWSATSTSSIPMRCTWL